MHKFNPADGKFQIQPPKDLHRNKIYKIATTEASLVLAKDQGIVEIKSLETGKSMITYQQAAQN